MVAQADGLTANLTEPQQHKMPERCATIAIMQTAAVSTSPKTGMRQPKRPHAWRIAAGVALASLALLAGCANTLTAKVTRFNQWPTDAAGQTFSFVPGEPERELELSAYQALVTTELERLGLRRAAEGQAGPFVVQLQASLNERERKRLEAVYSDQWVYVPPWRDAQGRLLGGHWVPDPMGARYVGDREVTRTVQESRLQVRITAAQPALGQARTVFEATALHEGRDGDLVEVVPYLVRAVFQDFPGANAQVRRVTFDLEKR